MIGAPILHFYAEIVAYVCTERNAMVKRGKDVNDLNFNDFAMILQHEFKDKTAVLIHLQVVDHCLGRVTLHFCGEIKVTMN